MIAIVYLRDVTPEGEIRRCLYVLPVADAIVKAAALSRSFARIYVVWHDATTNQIIFHLPPSVRIAGRWNPVR